MCHINVSCALLSTGSSSTSNTRRPYNKYIYIYRFQRHSLHVGGTAQSAKRLNKNGRSVKLCQHGVCSLIATFDLPWTIGVRTVTHLQIPPSSPSHHIIGDLQRFWIVPAKPLRIDVVSTWK